MSRLSSIYRSGGSGSSYSGRRNHLIVQKDEFPILDNKELLECLVAIDLPGFDDLVTKPTSQSIRSFFEQSLDMFFGVTAQQISQRAKGMTTNSNTSIVEGDAEANKEESNEIDDTESTLYVLVLFRACSNCLRTCGIYDFTLLDLMKPDLNRTRRILSSIVNYARFRDEFTIGCESSLEEFEKKLLKIEELENDNNRFTKEIEDLKVTLQDGLTSDDSNQKSTLKQINAFNFRLENELKKLQKAQQILTLEHSQYKEQKQRLIEKLEDHHYLNLESKKELEKLKTYLSTNPEVLTKIINDLKNTLNEYQTDYSNLEATFKNKSATIESIQVIEQELKSLFRILEEILNDLQKSEAAIEKLNNYNEFLEQQKLESSDYNRQVQQVKRQLNNMEEKIKKLRNQASERDTKSKNTLASLKADYEELVEERKTREQELDKKKELITNLEKQMANKRNEFQSEVRNAESAVSRLMSHLKLYLAEMNNKIPN